jgi:putative ABC transport system substrate-binding protein
VRRIAVLHGGDENDPVAKPLVSAFTQALADLGWANGRNVRMDLRWFGDDINRIPALAHELVGLQPDIILAGGNPATAALVARHAGRDLSEQFQATCLPAWVRRERSRLRSRPAG